MKVYYLYIINLKEVYLYRYIIILEKESISTI